MGDTWVEGHKATSWLWFCPHLQDSDTFGEETPM